MPFLPAPLTWDELWLRELKEVQSDLHQELAEAAPITFLCYQPIEKERFVKLQETKQNRPSLVETVNDDAGKVFLRNPSFAPWRSEIVRRFEPEASGFLPIPTNSGGTPVKKSKDRKKPHAGSDMFPSKDREYIRQIMTPFPAYEKTAGWWKHWPRLGLVYSVTHHIGAQAGVESEMEGEFSDRVLLLMAVSGGHYILKKRLRVIFNNSYSWFKDDKEYVLERDIPERLCTGQEAFSDKSLYVVCKLLLAHHLFYPHRPTVLSILEKLKSGLANQVLTMHGWPEAPWAVEPAGALSSSLNDLTRDISFLIWSLVKTKPTKREEQPLKPKKDSDLDSKLHSLVSMGLGILGGSIDVVDDGVFLVPPGKLTAVEDITIPFYDKLQVNKDERRNSECFIQTLCPVGKRLLEPAWKVTTLKGRKYPSRENVDLPKLEWLSKYIYARYILARGPQKPDTKSIARVSK